MGQCILLKHSHWHAPRLRRHVSLGQPLACELFLLLFGEKICTVLEMKKISLAFIFLNNLHWPMSELIEAF